MWTRALPWTAKEPGCKVTVANPTDAELVQACLDGRREAFDAIVERHQRHVYQLCYRFAGNHEDANDLTQDVFIRAYRGLKTFKGQASLGTWLYRIAVNVSLNQVGAKGRSAPLDPLLAANDDRLAAHDADLPEPSPLYWQHLSARIRDRVAGERIAPAWRAAPWPQAFAVRALVPVASAVVLVLAVVAGGLAHKDRRPTAGAPSPIASTAPADTASPLEDSEVWQVLTSAASEVPIEDAHAAGMGLPTGAVD